MKNLKLLSLCSVVLVSSGVFAGSVVAKNPPSKCKQGDPKCSCESPQQVANACIKVNLDLGVTTPWTGSQRCSLKVFADAQSPLVFAPESLYAVMGYTFKRIGNTLAADGVTPKEVVFTHPNGEPVYFVFNDGESLARPDPGFHIKMDERLQMVDAEGWACTRDPVYYDLYETDGTVRRFIATDAANERGRLVSITDFRGKVVTPADLGVDIVYGPDGVRQFLTPSRLADITVCREGYDVAVYPVASVPAKDSATGRYVLPGVAPLETLSVRSADDGKRVVVTLRKGGGDPETYLFDYVRDDWTLTRPSGVEERHSRFIQDSNAAQTVEETYSRTGELLARDEYNYIWQSWGFAATNHVEGFGGVTRTTTWDYYTSGNGKGQVRTEVGPTGLTTEYVYDACDRVISSRRSGPGVMTEFTTYSYASVDPSDVVPPVDTRPRTVVKTVNGIECERTYYVYSPLTNVVERAGVQGASYGAAGALRTVTAFCPVAAGDVCSGLVRSVRREDGRLDCYEYSLVTNIWIETVSHYHEQATEPVSGKTTRDVSVRNRRGEILEQKTEAYIDGSWYTISRDLMTYDATGKRIRTEDLAGRATVTAWDCCRKVSETSHDGSMTTWDYDEEGRMVAASRLIPLDMTNVTWLTTCYQYDALGRQVATWQTNLAAQVGLPVTRIRYDQLGRVIARVDQLGNTTTTEYSPDGRTVSVRNPNTSSVTYLRNADGDTLSITGTGVTPEFATRGVLADGTCWTKIVQGETADSPRFTKRYENMLGQTVHSEKSGFRGAVLASINTYDNYGRLVSTFSDGEPTTTYAYDTFGTRIATTRIVRADAPGGLTEWRKSESSSAYELRGSDVWLAQTTSVSCSDATIAPLVQSRAERVTGLNSSLLSQSLSTDVRGNVNESRVEYNGFAKVGINISPAQTGRAESHSRLGVAVRSVSATGVESRSLYDGLGRVYTSIDGRGNATRTEYDAFGRQSARVDADNNRTTYAYNEFGELVAVTNALGDAVVYAYDLRGHKTYEGGATYPVSYAYDLFGNKVSMTTYRDEDAQEGDVTTWLYDEASNCMTNKVYADGKGPSYDYDAHGRLIKRTWARGIETTYSYDAWGRLVRTDYSDETPSVVLAYDALGRQTRAIDAAGTTTFAYDAFGSLTSETVIGVAGTNTIERFGDTFGRDTGYALNGIRQSTLGYDPETGRLVTMLAAGSETPFTWNYLGGSDLKSSLTYPNGLTASWTYGNRGELLVVNNASPTGTISRYVYTYDAAGRRIGCDKSGSAFTTPDTYAYLYNVRGELTNATAAVDAAYRYSYDFDDIGNRETSSERGTNVTYAANNLNQYTQLNRTFEQSEHSNIFSPVYDADGSQTLVKTATGIWQVTYNGENRPVLWTPVEHSEQSEHSNISPIAMSFDRMGRRVVKNNQRFVYNGYLQIANLQCSTSNFQLAASTFVWDPSETVATRPLVCNRNNSVYYYAHDGNKNVSYVIAADGSLVSRCDYSPFGIVRVRDGADRDADSFCAISDAWWMSCEYYDVQLGLMYYNFRHYNPCDGRWIGRDFLPEIRTLNLYGFDSQIVAPDILGLVRFTDPDCRRIKSECQKAIDAIRSTLDEYIKTAKEQPDEWYQRALEAYRWPMPQGWRTKDEYLNSLGKLLKMLGEDMGPEVICCMRNSDVFLRNMCKNTASGYVRKGPPGLRGRIIMCPEGMNNSETYGGCGCLILHELLHKLGFHVKEQDPFPKAMDINVVSEGYIDTYIKNRDTENGMVRLARHLLKLNEDFKCSGYDIMGDSDEDQIWGPSINHIW